MADQHPLIRRHEAVEATLERFRDKPLEYGKNDCARMAAFLLKRLGQSVSLLSVGSYASPTAAVRTLKKLGHQDLPSLVDSLGFPRIAPAAALEGDLIALPAEAFGGALMIALNNGRVFGYFDGRFQVGQPLMFQTAWRTI